MNAQEHIIAWIESSRPHYDRLLQIASGQFDGSHSSKATHAFNLARDTYREMTRCGDAWASDHDATTILKAAILICEWRLEQ